MDNRDSPNALAEGQGVPPPGSGLRKRATAACRLCRQRKVRCSLALTGSPCLNCVRDNQDCEVVGRKRRTKSVRPSLPAEASRDRDADVGQEPPSAGPSVKHAEKTLGFGNNNVDGGPDTALLSLDPLSSSTTRGATPKGSEEHSVNSLVSAIMKDQNSPSIGPVPFYAGEQHGIGYILDILIPGASSPAKHYFFPRLATSTIPPENLAFLQAKGVFSLPSIVVCEALLRSYFHHVHPILPVVDAETVLSSYKEGGLKQVNLLLLWSIFSVAANWFKFIEYDIVKLAGFTDRKELKRCMFLRAKCLYDNGREEDKIALIQSVSIMAFGFSDIEDKTESWHWMGIAISLSQTLGFHRDPDREGYNQRLTDHQRQLWRRIWWSCVFRDRWLSFCMGRPLRINMKNCDTPMSSAEDVVSDSVGLDDSVKEKYIPPDLLQLAQRWIILLRISNVLGIILSKNYRPRGPMPTALWVKATEKEAIDCMADLPDLIVNCSRLTTFYTYHLKLHYEALVIALWRPYETKAAADIPSGQDEDWCLLAHEKVRTAAGNTNLILDKIIGAEMVSYIGPMTIPVLIPAMQTHLVEFKSSDSLSSQIGLNKLNFCMMVLNEIKKTFSSATFIHSIFLDAIERLRARNNAAVAPLSHGDKTPVSQEPQLPLPIEDYSFLSDPFWDTAFPFLMETS